MDVERFSTLNADGKEEEDYVIAFIMRGEAPYESDMNLSVLRISEYGNLIWHRRYFDVNRTGSSDPYIWDISSRITKMNATEENGQIFALAGERWDWSGTPSFYSMTINENGDIMTPFTLIQPGCTAWGPDLTWDGSDLVYSYIGVNTGIPGYVPSAFGYIKMSSNLSTITDNHIYYGFCENYPTSIEMSNDGNYISAGWIHQACSSGVYNPMLLKLDQSLRPQYFHVFNYNTGAQILGNHRTNLSSGFNYMPAKKDETSGTVTEKIRIIKADANGEACGFDSPELAEYLLEPSLEARDYNYERYNEIYEYKFSYSTPELYYTDCDEFVDNDGNPASYRLAQQARGIDVTIAPTLLSANETVYCRVNCQEDALLNILVVNNIGQVLFNKQEQVHQGYNQIPVSAKVLSPGLNMMRIMNGNTILQTVKLNVVE